MNRRLFLALAVLCALVGCQQPQMPSQPACRTVMLAFTASWCGECNKQKPVVAQIAVAGVDVRVYNVDANPALAKKYGITAVPTYILYVCGQERLRTNSAGKVLVIVSYGRR